MLENVWAYGFLWHGKNITVLSRRYLSDFEYQYSVVITSWEELRKQRRLKND